MVYAASRGEVPVRLGPGVRHVPDYGPSVMSRQPYTDPMQFELERERVLGRSWLLAARSTDIAAAGDWTSFESHGETIVITRQPDGSLAAFHNVCQHRGIALVSDWKGCGARRFSCPYHGWVYDTTGKLVGVPEREDFAEDHLRDVRAPQVAVDEWGGFVWINFAGPAEAPPLSEWIGPEIMADLGQFRMEDMVVLEVLEWDVPVSYKAIVDGFNEIYHVTALHHVKPEFTKSARDSSFHILDKNYMCFVPRAEHRDKLAVDWDHHKYAICHYVVFPNTIYNCNPEHIQVFNPIPVDVDRTKFLCWQLIYPGDRDDPEYAAYFARMEAHWKTLQHVVGEDISVYEQLARTKRSSGYTQHILSERECKIAHYHETIARLIRE
jgi:phenylpropionate dioxygenase-like ring-hydroxylating dioxygenase large terminal subunit